MKLKGNEIYRSLEEMPLAWGPGTDICDWKQGKEEGRAKLETLTRKGPVFFVSDKEKAEIADQVIWKIQLSSHCLGVGKEA